MKIAFIGTGVMGAPMALHLANNGYDVNVYNRTSSKAKALEPKVKAFDSLEACVKDADIVFTIVGYAKDVEDVFEVLINTCKEGTILVDMTTSSPTLAKKIAQSTSKHICLDAPVTGGDLGAINGTLSIMVGGNKDAYNTIYPLLETFGKTITYRGPSGSGQHAKLANQISIAGSLAGIAESLSYAKEQNLDLEDMLKVIVGGSASSWQGANNGPKMIQGDYKPGFFAKHFLKDLNLALEEKGDLDLPILTQVQKIFELLINEGYGDEGTQVMFEYYKNK